MPRLPYPEPGFAFSYKTGDGEFRITGLNPEIPKGTKAGISHRLSTLRDMDAICVLEEGRVVERGTYDELIAMPDGRFSRMRKLQR